MRERADGLAAVAGGGHLEPVQPQHERERIAHGRIVIDDEQAHAPMFAREREKQLKERAGQAAVRAGYPDPPAATRRRPTGTECPSAGRVPTAEGCSASPRGLRPARGPSMLVSASAGLGLAMRKP